MVDHTTLQLPLIRQEEVAKDTRSFYFQRTQEFDFHPGQYITMHFGQKNDDYDNLTHDFTIASSPLITDHILITTKTTSHSNFKEHMLKLQPGQKVRFSSPRGGFYFKEEIKNYVFLAGGIGITPFRSMLEFITHKNLNNLVTLIASFSTTEDIVYYDELTKLADIHSNIKVIYTVSRPEESKKSWSGETGRITSDLIKRHIEDVTLPKFLIVGPPTMVSSMEETVNNMNVQDEQIQIESFTGY